MSSHRYLVRFYNSGGYRDSEVIETDYELRPSADGIWSVYEGDKALGGEEMIEQMVCDQRGWIEEYTLTHVEMAEETK